MKYILTGLVLLALAGCEQGSYFNKDTKQSKSDAVMRIDATGEDFRVYEFTPQTRTDLICIFAAASNKGGLVCVDKVKPHG